MKKLILILTAVSAFLLASCTAEITIKSTAKGTELSFNGAAEKGLEKLIASMGAEGQNFIDPVQISSELKKEGFANVTVSQKKSADLSISLLAPDSKNYLFESGILKADDELWVADFSKENLKAFYNSADTTVVQFLDLLLAPVFNDEEMTVDEYIEVIGSFYGESVAQELAASKIKVVSKKSYTKVQTYSLPEILCGLVQ